MENTTLIAGYQNIAEDVVIHQDEGASSSGYDRSSEGTATLDGRSYTVQDLNQYCRLRGKPPKDLLVDDYDPIKLSKDASSDDEEYLILSTQVDDIVSDEILSLNPPDMNYLCSIQEKHRTNRILRHIGRSYYLALDSRREIVYKELNQVIW